MAYPILKPNSTWFTPNVSTITRSTIITINIVDTYAPEDMTTVTDSWDASVAQDGSIMCYVEGTVLTIAGNGSGKIAANEDSSFMFSDIDKTDYFTALTALNNLSTIDFSTATNFKAIFRNCLIGNLDVSGIDTSNVTIFDSAFRQCSKLVTLDLSSWDVSKCESLYAMFFSCSALTEVNVTGWNTPNLTNVEHLFNECTKLQRFDATAFNAAKLTTISLMFQNCSQLTELDVSGWDTSNVINMSFAFWGCKGLTRLAVENWNVSNVENFDHVFAHCHNLVVDVTNWRTSSKCKYYTAMFHTNANEYLDVSGFDTSGAVSMALMFEANTKLKKIKGLENFDTSNVASFQEMFFNCHSIEELDFSNFDTRKADTVTPVRSDGKYPSDCTYFMLNGCRSLKKITLGENFTFAGDGTATGEQIGTLPVQKDTFIEDADGNWYTIDGTAYAVEEVPNLTAATYYASKKLALWDRDIKTYVHLAALREYHEMQNTKISTEISNALASYAETDPTVPAWAKAASKPTYTASEVGALPSTTVIPDSLADLTADSEHRLVTDTEKSTWNSKADVSDIPTKVSQLTNDSGYLTSAPVTSVNGKTGAVVLTASDVGADASGAAGSAVSAHNANTSAHADIREQIDQLSSEKEALTEKINEIEEDVIDIKAESLQQVPLFANSIEECTDTSKLYVLPDGMIYAYMLTEKEVEVECTGGYTNLLPTATDTDRATIYNGKGYKENTRLSGSGGGTSTAGSGKEAMCSTGFIFPVAAGDKLRIKGITPVTGSSHYVVGYDSSNARTGNDVIQFISSEGTLIFTTNGSSGKYTIDDDGTIVYTINTAKLGANVNAVRICAAMDENTIITINEEIVEGTGTTTEIVTEYAWVNTGRAFVPADYEDRIIDLEGAVEELESEIQTLKDTPSMTAESLMYIDPAGDDTNDGLTKYTPKKTVKACVLAGAKKISAKRGVYNEVVNLVDIGELEILPTDNDKTYAVGEIREPIVFDTSDKILPSSLSSYNSIKRVSYSNSSNTQFDKVFTKQSQTPVVGTGYGFRYNSTIWLMSADEKTVCIKLKPVLTIAECESEANTFTYVEGYVYINADITSVEQIVIPTNWGTGFYINKAQKITMREVEVRFSGSYNIDLRNCAYFELYKCACKYTSYGSGFHPFNSNGTMTACYATKNYDGYGISGHGHTTYVDCISEFNFDDGMSHHDGCEGTVIGGRYEGNGKGGNTPAYGAKVNIYGGIYKDNASFGIGYLWADGYEPASGIIEGVTLCGNTVGLTVQKNCVVTATSCLFEGNTTDKDIKGTLTEYKNTSTVVVPDNGNNNGSNSGDSSVTLPYTNQLPLAVNSSGTAYIGDNGEKGYRAGYRVSSSAEEKAATGYACTGFIPAVAGDIIRIKNITKSTASNDASAYTTAYFFTSSFAKTTGAVSLKASGTYEDDTYTFTIPSYDTIAYFRVTLLGVTSNTIITVNEEIVENTGNGGNTGTGGSSDNNSSLTEAEKLELIKTWDAPIYDANIPIFQLTTEKAAITEAEKTVAAVYAKYDALMARHPNYITKTNLGMCSDGVTPVYRYDFREPEPHRGVTGKKEWSETKAKAIIVSGIHWEWGGIFGLYNALEEVAENADLYHLRRNTHLIVLPVCNPYAVANMSVRNANLVEIHRNFEVDFIYPGESGYIELGERSHGGTEPLSEVETQYIDNIFKANTDAAFFLTCHSNQTDTVYGTGFTWASPATYYMCNMHYRLVDKLSKVWMEKYGDELAAGIAEYRTENTPEWDNRLGSAYLSTTNGTETKQATKYGIQATNIEITDAFRVHGTTANPEPALSSFTMSRGAEVYANFLLTAFGVYDRKDKKEYAPNLSWSE